MLKETTIYLKQSIAILAVLLFMLPSISKVWIMVDFKIHQDYIAKVLCINKDEPSSGCNGKCHLKEQLQKTEDQDEKESPKNIKQNIEITYYLPEEKSNLSTCLSNKHKQLFCYKNSLKRSDYSSRLLRPPQFI